MREVGQLVGPVDARCEVTAADRFGEPSDLDQRRRTRRGDKAGRFKIVYVEGDAPDSELPGLATRCRQCGTAGVVLHQDPTRNDVDRVLCGRCQGLANADRMGLGPRRSEP